MRELTASDIERFVEKVGPVLLSGCREWTGSCDSKGYGRFNVDNIPVPAHRVAWVIARGPIPDGLCVCHRCDNPPCVAEGCLFLGTQADNLADMRAKAREARGERNGAAKMTAQQVLEIRRRYAQGESQASLRREFGLTPNPMHAIVHRRTWRHV